MNFFGKLLIGILGAEYLKNRIASGIKEGLEQVQTASSSEQDEKNIIEVKEKKPLSKKQKKWLIINLIAWGLLLLIILIDFIF